MPRTFFLADRLALSDLWSVCGPPLYVDNLQQSSVHILARSTSSSAALRPACSCKARTCSDSTSLASRSSRPLAFASNDLSVRSRSKASANSDRTAASSLRNWWISEISGVMLSSHSLRLGVLQPSREHPGTLINWTSFGSSATTAPSRELRSRRTEGFSEPDSRANAERACRRRLISSSRCCSSISVPLDCDCSSEANPKVLARHSLAAGCRAIALQRSCGEARDQRRGD